MAKMTDDELLDLLRRKEEASADYVHGQLGQEREQLMREYHRMPYGNEEEGNSQIVASDVSDSVEWVLPALLKVFTSTDKAVSFEPSREADVKPAEQATDACNYVFYRQNNGFLVLYTALKDALTVRNCAVNWRKESKETVSSIPFKGATGEMLAMMLQEPDTEIGEVSDPQVVPDQMGMPVEIYSGRIKKTEKKTVIKVEAFSPEDLLVDREWTSPLLEDCPYVARLMPVTLTDLKLMGFKNVTADDLRASDQADYSADADFRLSKINQNDSLSTAGNAWGEDHSQDESMAEGWLRIEYVEVDADGDGVAERLEIYRLREKILKKEVVSHVPIATFSPILNTHRWDGMSMADAVSDLQKLHTELLRQTLNNLYLTNNPRTKVLTDANWSPLANIDDLLDSRAGGIIRQRDINAVTEQVTPFAAGASMPMLEYVQGMRENRTGVSRTSMGLNPDSLNNTATGRQIDQSAAQQRIELIARIAAEILLKPIFKGILKLLTDGDMEKLAFRLRDEFVEYDPNEWRDSYDMTIHVGLGTGDRMAQTQSLMSIWQMQQAAMPMGIVTPKHLYQTAVKVIENAGFKDVQSFLQDPSKQPPQPPQPPLPLQIEQMKLQADMQKFQAQAQAEIQKFQAETQQTMEVEKLKAQAKLQEVQANLELQASNDQRDAQREAMKAQYEAQLEQLRLELDKYKTDQDNRTRITVAQISKLGAEEAMQVDMPMDAPAPKPHEMMAQAIAMLAEKLDRPKQVVRDESGKVIGVA